jgi:hypothetical protein
MFFPMASVCVDLESNPPMRSYACMVARRATRMHNVRPSNARTTSVRRTQLTTVHDIRTKNGRVLVYGMVVYSSMYMHRSSTLSYHTVLWEKDQPLTFKFKLLVAANTQALALLSTTSVRRTRMTSRYMIHSNTIRGG